MRNPQTDFARVRGLSLERKIPLLMTAVLVIILGGGVFLAYREVRRASEVVMVDRLQGFTNGLATAAGASLPRLSGPLRDVARNPAVQRVLTDPTPSASDLRTVNELLAELPLPADSGMVSELMDTSGRVVASVGEKPAGDSRPAYGGVVTSPDSIAMGGFYESNGRVYYGTTRPVTRDGTLIGTIAQRRRLNTQGTADRDIQALAGENVRVLFRNTDGSFWTTLGGQPIPAPADLREVRGMRLTCTRRHAKRRVIVFEKAVERTPWVVLLELPMSALSRGPKEMLRRFA